MKRFKEIEEVKLNINYIKRRIEKSKIEFVKYAETVEQRKGRPSKELVNQYLTNKLNKLYKTVKGRKNRIVLSFYLSRKYDLKVIIRFEKDMVKIITYYHYLKKKIEIY